MSDRQAFKFPSNFLLGLAVLAVLPALWSWGSAVVSAASTGEVLVISLGRTETYRRMVPWMEGWTRFAAPPLLLLSVVLALTSEKRTLRWRCGVALAALSLALLLFSAWFITVGGAAGFAALNGFMLLCFYVDGRFGRATAFWLMLVTALVLVYFFAPRYVFTMQANPLVDTDAQGRPLPSVAPTHGGRLHAR